MAFTTRCMGCIKPITKRNESGMCAQCKSNLTIMVSTTNAKKKYMLTQDEIDNAGLYYCTISCMGTPGYKYLVYDIEKLAEGIFADIGSNDARKQKYLENIKDDGNKTRLVDNMRENISIQLEEMEFEIDDDAEQFIKKVARIKYFDDFDNAFKIVKRYVKINSLIDMCDDESEFIDDAKQCKEMDTYIFDHGMTLCGTFYKIVSSTTKQAILRAQRKKIDSFVSKNIDMSLVEFVESLPQYKSYVRKEMSNAEFKAICAQILEHVERKGMYDKLLASAGSKYAREIQSSPECTKYTKDLNYTCDIQCIIENIKRNVDERCMQYEIHEKKQRERKERHAKEVEKYYKKYVEKYGEQSEKQSRVCNTLASKISNVDNVVENLKLNNPLDYEDVKLEYLMGDISFWHVKDSLQKIKRKYLGTI